jgi:hypothetical protein
VRAVGRSVGQSVGNCVRAGLLLACLGAIPVPCSLAQNRPPARPPARLPELTVYLMTMGPGKQVWERFGHNAIWIHDPAQGTDQAYNYGLFDFHQHNFLLRFVQGRMWYWMQGFPAQSYVESYRRANRSVWVQELEMPLEKRRELQAFLEWNEQPEHRFYHYDYYQDNCSTRVRDALDRALGGRLRERTENVMTGRTYRFHTQRLTANDPLVFTGLLLALGNPVDRPISAWQEMFLPLALREWVRTVTVTGADGRGVPLVRSERTLFQSSEPNPPAQPPAWVPMYLLGGVAVGGLALGLSGAARRSAVAKWGFLLMIWTWCLASGIAGLVLVGLWALTDHAAAYNNENVLQANVLTLPLIWLLTPVVFGSPARARPALVVASTVAGLSLLGLILKLFPQFYQVNGDVIALALPAHAGVAAAAYRLSTSQEPRTRVKASLASR